MHKSLVEPSESSDQMKKIVRIQEPNLIGKSKQHNTNVKLRTDNLGKIRHQIATLSKHGIVKQIGI